MTWTLFSRSIVPNRSLLADPLHVTLHRDLAHEGDLAVLDQDQTGAVGGAMVLVGIGERRGDAPRVPLLEALERVLHALAGRIRPGPLDGLGGHEGPQPAPHVRRS